MMMMERVGTVERAYQLAAQSGSIDEVRRQLMVEGYSNVEAHLSAPQLRRALKELLAATGSDPLFEP
jgi:hypothetical protein